MELTFHVKSDGGWGEKSEHLESEGDKIEQHLESDCDEKIV